MKSMKKPVLKMTRNQTEDPKVFNNKFALKMKESKPKVTFDFKQTSVI